MCDTSQHLLYTVVSFTLALQARDPSVHAAILAHLNQKYGSGSGSEPPNAEKNKQVSSAASHHPILRLCV